MDFVYVGSGVVVVLCIAYAACRWMWSAMMEGEFGPDEHEEVAKKPPGRRKRIHLDESMIELNKACEESKKTREYFND